MSANGRPAVRPHMLVQMCQMATEVKLAKDEAGNTFIILQAETPVGSIMLPLMPEHARGLAARLETMADSVEGKSQIVKASPEVLRHLDSERKKRG